MQLSEKDNRLIEEVFKYDELTSDEQDHIYNIFKASYEKSTSVSWDKNKFDNKANGWLFFGDKENGFITVRKQNSGIYKLTGAAGTLMSIGSGLSEIINMNVPIWGMMDDKLANMLSKKYGFIRPAKWLTKMLIKLIPSSIFGNTNFDINDDGSITLHYSDVGDAKKYFVANKEYYKFLLNNVATKTTAIPNIALIGLRRMIGA